MLRSFKEKKGEKNKRSGERGRERRGMEGIEKNWRTSFPVIGQLASLIVSGRW